MRGMLLTYGRRIDLNTRGAALIARGLDAHRRVESTPLNCRDARERTLAPRSPTLRRSLCRGKRRRPELQLEEAAQLLDRDRSVAVDVHVGERRRDVQITRRFFLRETTVALAIERLSKAP
jgi:hypothetical protein